MGATRGDDLSAGPKSELGESDGRSLAFRLDHGQTLRWQLVAIAVLLVASTLGYLAAQLFGETSFLGDLFLVFWVDQELTVPSLYSGLVIALCAVMFAWIARLERSDPQMRRFWRLMTVVIAYVAVDELLRLHEKAADPVREQIGVTEGPLFFAWVVPALAAVALLAIAVAKPMLRLEAPTRNGFVLAGSVYVAGAAGFEMLGAAYVTARGGETIGSYGSRVYLMSVTIEEGLEMVGMALLLATLVRHIQCAHAPARASLAIG